MSSPIVIERLVKAPPERVYGYLTDSELWAKWQGFDAIIEASPGGIFRMQMANSLTARGQFLAVEPNRRVVFTWGWVDHPGVPPGSTTVEIDLITEGDHTRIRLTHRDLAPEEQPLHEKGWSHHLSRLVLTAEGGEPGPDQGPVG